jgi:anti-sigma B factor antagonist
VTTPPLAEGQAGDASGNAPAAVVTLRPSGELDVAAAPELWAEVEGLIRSGHHHLVVDLGRVSLLDTAMVSVLVRTSSALQASGGTLRLVAVAPPARHVLSIVGLDHLVDDGRPVAGAVHAGNDEAS